MPLRFTGLLTLTVEGQRTGIGAGDALRIPPERSTVSTTFAFGRRDNTGSRHTLILRPDYFREIAAVVNTAAGGAPDPAGIGAVMRRHGLTLAAS